MVEQYEPERKTAHSLLTLAKTRSTSVRVKFLANRPQSRLNLANLSRERQDQKSDCR